MSWCGNRKKLGSIEARRELTSMKLLANREDAESHFAKQNLHDINPCEPDQLMIIKRS